MKKLILSTFLFSLIIIGCSSDENIETSKNEDLSLQQKDEKTSEEITFKTKILATFSKVVQNKTILKSLSAYVFEDNIMMRNDGVYEDNIMLNAYTIKDDLIMGKTTFEDEFTETYNQLYAEDNMNYASILTQFPKLYFGIPRIAFDDYETWKENGAVVSSKSYNIDDNKLESVTKGDVISLIGDTNYKELIEETKREYEVYYMFSENEKTTIVASDENKGTILTKENEIVNIASFNIIDEGNFNNIEIIENEESSILAQNNMTYQTYVDIYEPDSCNSYFVFYCNSIALDNYIQNSLDNANRDCVTYRACLPICCNGSIMYMMFEFAPDSIKCAKTMDYLNVLSMYANFIGY